MCKHVIWLVLIAFFGCGENSINKMFVTQKDKQRISSLIAKGRMAFDRGDLDTAEEMLSQARRINIESEEAVRLLGYVYLARADITPVSMVRKIMDNNKKNTTTKDAADALSKLSVIVAISKADLSLMAKEDTEGGKNPYFTGITVFEPLAPGSINNIGDPRRTVNTLRWLNEAIKIICPFVQSSVTASSVDPRHTCTKVSKPGGAATHLLFALAHMIESLVFNTVLLYNDSSFALAATAATETAADSSNLFKRVAAINKTNFSISEIGDYVRAVAILKGNVEKVFDTSADSMLSAVLIDLKTVVGAFEAIPGIPKEVTKQVSDGLKSIEDTVAKAGKSTETGADATASQTAALKSQLNTALSTTLKTSIESFTANKSSSGATDEQIQEVCTAYKDIATTGLEGLAGVTLPSGC